MKGTVKKMQVKNKKALSALSIIAGILLIVPMFRPYEAAAENNKKITLSCRQDDTILNGMEWTLYRVGERNGNKIKFIPELNNIFISHNCSFIVEILFLLSVVIISRFFSIPIWVHIICLEKPCLPFVYNLRVSSVSIFLIQI